MRSRRIRIEGLKILPLIAGFLGMIGAGTANALTIGFDDPSVNGDGFDFLVTDADGDGNLSFSTGGQTLDQTGDLSGSDWVVNISAVGSADSLTPNGTLEEFGVRAESTSDGVLRIAAWDSVTGPVPQPTYVGTAAPDDELGGELSVTFSQFTFGSTPEAVDTTPTSFPAGTLPDPSSTASGGPISSTSDSIFASFSNYDTSGDFDLGIVVTVDHDSAANTKFDATLVPTPLPAAAWLMGSALVLLAGIGRRASRRDRSAVST